MTEPQRNRLASWIVGAVGLVAALALLPNPFALLVMLLFQVVVKGFRHNLSSWERPIDLMSTKTKMLVLCYLLGLLGCTLWVVFNHPELIHAAIENMYGLFAVILAAGAPMLLVSARQEWTLFVSESQDGP